jgi:hypothetical protein
MEKSKSLKTIHTHLWKKNPFIMSLYILGSNPIVLMCMIFLYLLAPQAYQPSILLAAIAISCSFGLIKDKIIDLWDIDQEEIKFQRTLIKNHTRILCVFSAATVLKIATIWIA